MPLDPSENLYIIEIGAGHGKFTHLFLQYLEEMKTLQFPMEKIKVCAPPPPLLFVAFFKFSVELCKSNSS